MVEYQLGMQMSMGPITKLSLSITPLQIIYRESIMSADIGKLIIIVQCLVWLLQNIFQCNVWLFFGLAINFAMIYSHVSWDNVSQPQHGLSVTLPVTLNFCRRFPTLPCTKSSLSRWDLWKCCGYPSFPYVCRL
jgi:hypothetical protein